MTSAMLIDRNRFLALALGMSLGACGGGQKPAPAPSNTSGAMEMGTTDEAGGTARTMDDLQCNGYDPTNECVSWNDGTVLQGYAPTSECIRWTPTDECNAWAYSPTGEGGPTSEAY
jgi:hypothetical protein